jgi:hypothetical protein
MADGWPVSRRDGIKKYVGIIVCALLSLGLQSTASQAGQRKEPPPSKPMPATGEYASGNYGLTFKVPEHTMYCPLPADWVGSDHGTVLFLEPPRACYGAGYPSSSRGFEPADVPRIEIYYGYDLSEDDAKPPPCKAVGTAMLFGKQTNLCGGKWQELSTVTVSGRYMADEPAELSVTLAANPSELSRYIPQFTALVASTRTCSERWTDGKSNKKTFVIGHGPRCPDSLWH